MCSDTGDMYLLQRYLLHCVSFFFFFKQKTAYEMRISDWSSDVCSSDLARAFRWRGSRRRHRVPAKQEALQRLPRREPGDAPEPVPQPQLRAGRDGRPDRKSVV